MTDPNPYGLQVIVTRGGLSSTAHVVNVIAVLLTCGLWIPAYVLMAILTSPKNVQVLAPVGTPQEVITEAHTRAAMLTPEERRAQMRNLAVLGIIVGLVFLLCLSGFVVDRINR